MSEVSKILKIFDKNGLFDEGVELIGSWCFYMYQTHLGVKKFPLVTPDIDFCIPNPYKGSRTVSLADELKGVGFNVAFNSDGSVYFWGPEIKIEFVTEEKGSGLEAAVAFKTLGIKATALRYMSILFEDPIRVVSKGVAVKIPKPVNFCLHKLLVSGKRKRSDKKIKDIEQAVYTSAIVDEAELIKYFCRLPGKWQKAIVAVLDKAGTMIPHLKNEVDSLKNTLQKAKNRKM